MTSKAHRSWRSRVFNIPPLAKRGLRRDASAMPCGLSRSACGELSMVSSSIRFTWPTSGTRAMTRLRVPTDGTWTSKSIGLKFKLEVRNAENRFSSRSIQDNQGAESGHRESGRPDLRARRVGQHEWQYVRACRRRHPADSEHPREACSDHYADELSRGALPPRHDCEL